MKAAFRHGRPFIRPEEAHLNIGFSCIAYLNTSFRLLPQHSSEEERRLWVLQGLHGLQIYANQFWHKHVLTYMDLAVAQRLQAPEYLARQLEDILKYSKAKPPKELIPSNKAPTCKAKEAPIRNYHSLEKFPALIKLVSSLEEFRNGLKNHDWTQKSIEGRALFLNLK